MKHENHSQSYVSICNDQEISGICSTIRNDDAFIFCSVLVVECCASMVLSLKCLCLTVPSISEMHAL